MSYVRRSARVFVTDRAGRLLLLRCNLVADRPGVGQIWVTPGGGVQRGESLREAAARELWEEIGLRFEPDELWGPIAFSEGLADINNLGPGLYRDDFFCFAVGEHDVDTVGQDDFERGQINEYRWWSLDEIRESAELLVPLRMADLLVSQAEKGRAADRVPARPVALPFHH